MPLEDRAWWSDWWMGEAEKDGTIPMAHRRRWGRTSRTRRTMCGIKLSAHACYNVNILPHCPVCEACP